MKDWWRNLAVREKQTLLIGSLLAVVFVIYIFFWLPLEETVRAQRENIKSNQALLAWMQQADQQIQQSQKNPSIIKKSFTGSLLSFTQGQLHKTDFEPMLTEIKQGENDTVQLRFKEVNFDKLITWLATLTQDYQLIIVRMGVTPTATLGAINSEIVLGPR